MSFLKKICCLFFLPICLFAQKQECSFLQDKLASTILQYQPEMIQAFTKGKLYLSEEYLSFDGNKAALISSNETFVLPVICFDLRGVYLPVNDYGLLVTCGVCGYQFELTELVTHCPNCGHGSFPR